MLTIRFALPSAALAAAAVMLAPTPTRAYSVFGDTLDLTQRDYRIWNNFTDPEANDNQSADPDYPGAFGAALAIRKGVAEWGSGPHGKGTSDPTQAILGSGGSNFDAFFSGYCMGPGSQNANIISMIEGTSAVKAFTNIPIRDGWRIRFWEDPYVWNDGPDAVLAGGNDGWDIQGVTTHEFGHALGLDHSSDPEATMFMTSPDKGLSFRSIEADDIAGVQFLYGVRSPDKPLIESYSLQPGGFVLLEGRGFDPTDNEVWFTHLARILGPDGPPVKVKGVPSTDGGSRLLVQVPAEAGPGDIAVKLPGAAFWALSNVWPFDPRWDLLDHPLAYGEGKLTSAGTTPTLTPLNNPSAHAGAFTMEVQGATGTVGMLLSSEGRANLPFQGGTLLVAAPIHRDAIFGIDIFGVGEVSLTTRIEAVGLTRHYQVWFRDTGDPFGSGLTNGLKVTFLP